MCGFIGFGHTLPQLGIFVGLHGKDECTPAFRYTGPGVSVRVCVQEYCSASCQCMMCTVFTKLKVPAVNCIMIIMSPLNKWPIIHLAFMSYIIISRLTLAEGLVD